MNFYFDMDGTIADLYNVEGWLADILSEQEGLFDNLFPLVDEEQFGNLCEALESQGHTFGIITWLPNGCSAKYAEIVREEKYQWARRFFGTYIQYFTFVALPYGTPKQKALIHRSQKAVLFDDNHEVIELWKTPTQRKGITVTGEFGDAYQKLLDFSLTL